MMTLEEQKRVFKAINNVSKKIMDIQKQLDDYFSMKHEENVESIKLTEDAIIELAGLIDENKTNESKGGQE